MVVLQMHDLEEEVTKKDKRDRCAVVPNSDPSPHHHLPEVFECDIGLMRTKNKTVSYK